MTRTLFSSSCRTHPLRLLFASLLFLGLRTGAHAMNPSSAPKWDTMPDTWVATDGLGRTLPGYDEAGPPRPDRFVGTNPPAFKWIPYGGGVNRCVGAAFAHMEMDVTLRTLLRELRFAPTDAPGERRHWRGVATVPGRGGRAVVYRRTAKVSSDADSASLAEHAS